MQQAPRWGFFIALEVNMTNKSIRQVIAFGSFLVMAGMALPVAWGLTPMTVELGAMFSVFTGYVGWFFKKNEE
jgi:hypothetical protein